jgi:hypothetical protein
MLQKGGTLKRDALKRSRSRAMRQPVAAVVLHLRSRYVSKAAILKGRVPRVSV